MTTDKNILLAFMMNLGFSIFEFIGGAATGSVAIVSDAVHDMGDAISICLSYILERKSRKAPDDKYSYGYARYSVIGGAITTVILLCGSVAVIAGAVNRLMHPADLNYNGMIILAIIGAVINFVAAWVTHRGDSVNQRAVNLHMLEDVLGWVVVLLGAIVMYFTDWVIIDPIMSIAVAVFIFISAVKNLNFILGLFLEKVPSDVDIDKMCSALAALAGVQSVHHVHVWSMDGQSNYATMHVVATSRAAKRSVKEAVRHLLADEFNINHVTMELEEVRDQCDSQVCRPKTGGVGGGHKH